MAQKIKFNIIKSLFNLFSFLADKTNGWGLFVKPKIVLGTIILGLGATACGTKDAKQDTQEQTEIDTITVEIIQTDTINADSIPQKPITTKKKKNRIQKQQNDDEIIAYYMPDFPPEEDYIVFCYVDIKPEFPGGNKALMKWLNDNINYPIVAQENGIQGKVFVNFIVRSDGRIDGVKVTESAHPILDNEAMRLVKSMPRWKPGARGGNRVHSYFILPVTFILKEDDKK